MIAAAGCERGQLPHMRSDHDLTAIRLVDPLENTTIMTYPIPGQIWRFAQGARCGRKSSHSTLCLVTGAVWLASSLAGGALLFAKPPSYDHVVVVIEENHAFDEIIGSSQAPFINSLANEGVLFTDMYALTHPSQPNYIHLFSGSNQGVTGDSLPVGTPFQTPNLGSALLDNGRTSRAIRKVFRRSGPWSSPVGRTAAGTIRG